MQEKRYFTVEEANRCIPQLVKAISKLQVLKDELEQLHAVLTPVFKVISSNGGHKDVPAFLKTAEAFQTTVENIEQLGCHLKGLEPGLVDFPHLRDGKEVYLCWRYGEPEIAYWHDIEGGFSGRKPL